MGDHSESLVEVKNIHNEKASMFRGHSEVGVEDTTKQNSGAVTRISGDPSWRNFGKYMEWAAVDTLVKLTKGNVDAAHTS